MSAYSAAVLADSPNGYWKLANLLDSSGNGLTLTVGGVASAVAGIVPGDPDGAYQFVTTGYLTTPNNVKLDLGDGPLTVEAWVKRNQSVDAGYQGIVTRSGGTYYVRINPSGFIEFIKSATAVIVTSTVAIADTNLHHIVATKNGTAVNLYIDGIDVTGAVTNSTLVNNGFPLQIGAEGGPAEQSNLTADEVAIYPSVLSAARVLAHYNAGISPASVATPPMVTYSVVTHGRRRR